MYCNSFLCTCFFPVAIDSVEITSDLDRSLYTDENVTLTCSVLLSASVDTAVDVSVVWSGPRGDTMSIAERVTESEPYQSTLTLSSLTTSDSGDYTCTATADPCDSPFVTAHRGSAAVNVAVGRFNDCYVSVTEYNILKCFLNCFINRGVHHLHCLSS